MTHTDAGALLKLADEYEAGLRKMEVAGYEEFSEVIPKHKLVIAALRQAASQGSAGGERSEVQIRDAALEEAAKIAETGCLVPPDGGSPTEDEREMCEGIASAIRVRKLFPRAAQALPEDRQVALDSDGKPVYFAQAPTEQALREAIRTALKIVGEPASGHKMMSSRREAFAVHGILTKALALPSASRTTPATCPTCGNSPPTALCSVTSTNREALPCGRRGGNCQCQQEAECIHS